MNMLEISGCIFLCEYLMWIILSIGYEVIFEWNEKLSTP